MNNSTREETEIDLLRLAQVLWQHIVIIISIMVICAAAGYAAAAFVIAPTYSASADMIVNNQQDQTQSTAVTTGDLSASSTLVDTYAVILKSHTILEQVIADLNLDTTYDALADSITVTAVDSTQVMRITVKAGSSEEAMQIVSRIVELAPDAIMNTVNAGSVKTVDTPWTSGKPVSPSKSKFTALAGLLGLVVSGGIVILRELLNNTFQSEEDVRKVLGLHVLGVIPLEELGMKKGGNR